MAAVSVPVLCLPHAGAGASFFQTWGKLPGHGVDVRPVQLPGREERIDEEPFQDVASAVLELGPELLLDPDLLDAEPRPATVSLFGHSLGAVLAYELARFLQAQAEVWVAHLFVSGSPAPWRGRDQRASGLNDEGFLRQVERLAGYRHPAFDIPELHELLVPLLRADVHMHEVYRPLPGPRLDAPITCFRGTGDDLVSAEEAREWRLATTGGFESVELPGGHMYLVEGAGPLLAAIGERLAGVSEGAGVCGARGARPATVGGGRR